MVKLFGGLPKVFPLSDFRAWVALVVFLLEILLIHVPLKLPIIYPVFSQAFIKIAFKNTSLSLNYSTGPILGVLILLATTTLSWDQLISGIVGDERGIQPLSVLILVYSLAYICISLDLTGVFSCASLMVVTRCGKSGVGLFIGLFFLTIFIGAIASNDVVILTLSPLICYLSLTLSIDPWPFLIAEFVAANTASMALYIGNPTNVVISMAYDISFLRYSKLLSLPFLGAALVQLGLLVVVYWKSIPKSIQAIDASPRVALVRPRAALIGLLALLLCIFALVLSSLWHVSVWKVTLPFAILVAAIDLFEDVFVAIKSSQRANKGTEDDECFDLTVEKKTAPAHSFHTVPADDVERQTAPSFRSVPQPSKKAYSDFIAESNVKPLEPNENSYGAFLVTYFPRFTAVLGRLPWGILPFLLGMFICVEAIQITGWTQRLASGLIVLLPSSSIFWCLGIGILASLLCGAFNNLPAAILLARTLTFIDFSEVPSIKGGAVLGLIVACNLGALLTSAGSLAGLMWRDILLRKGLIPTTKILLRTIFIIFPFTLLASLLILIILAQIFDTVLV